MNDGHEREREREREKERSILSARNVVTGQSRDPTAPNDVVAGLVSGDTFDRPAYILAYILEYI